MRLRALALLAVLLGCLGPALPSAAQEARPTVRAVLFFSPACGHCEYVIQEVLPPLFVGNGGPWEVRFDESGARTSFYLLSNGTLEFLLVDVTLPEGAALFQAAGEAFAIESQGVPRLIVSSEVMVGSQEIPDRLPDLLTTGLEAPGIDWPAIPGLEDALAAIPDAPVEPTSTSSSTTSIAATSAPPNQTLPLSGGSLGDRFGRDALANSLAVGVLVGMLVSLAVAFWWRPSGHAVAEPGVAFALVAGAGTLVAAYLAYIELGNGDAVCGPVGDCNVVQQSEYARILGIPVGMMGLIGYAALLTGWLLQRGGSGWRVDLTRIILLGGTVAGVLFSAYLTFLEPFVIGATCAWCLSSAILVTVLMWLALRPGLESWRRVRRLSGQMELQLE